MKAKSGDENDVEYFSSYFDVAVHRLMLEDKPRTLAYKAAIENNAKHYFKDKVVMDVGAGNGILSLLAFRAGAKRVYAVEASLGLADVLEEIVAKNAASDVINVIRGRVEDVDLKGARVDVIVSEWMGFYLLHESMLNSVICARDRFLNEESGILLPSHAALFSAVCRRDLPADDVFWNDVYGFDMTPMKSRLFNQDEDKPKVATLHPQHQILTKPNKVAEFDLRYVTEDEIRNVAFDVFASTTMSGPMDGVALWFDVDFDPTKNACLEKPWTPNTLSTSPWAEKTHWEQTVIPLRRSQVEADEIIGWRVRLDEDEIGNRRSYALTLEMLDPETDEHPTPCDCQMAKCALMQALLAKEENAVLESA